MRRKRRRKEDEEEKEEGEEEEAREKEDEERGGGRQQREKEGGLGGGAAPDEVARGICEVTGELVLPVFQPPSLWANRSEWGWSLDFDQGSGELRRGIKQGVLLAQMSSLVSCGR